LLMTLFLSTLLSSMMDSPYGISMSGDKRLLIYAR